MPFAWETGGAQRMLHTLARRALDHDVQLRVVFHEEGAMADALTALGATAAIAPLGRFRDLGRGARVVAELRRVIRRERPDLVLAWLPRSYPYLVTATRLTAPRTPLAWWQHHNGEGEEALTRLVTRLPAAGIVCESQAVADIQARVRPSRRLIVVHPGTEPPAIPEPAALAELRAELGIAPDATVVALPGRLVEWKGQERFLAALALLRERGLDVTGLLIGGGEPGAEERMRATARDLGVTCVVTGHIDDPTAHMALADVIVNASENEPFGMVVTEAMSLGVAVVAIGNGGPLEIVEDGVTGLLAPDGSPAALADTIATLAADSALRERLGAAGRVRYAERFTAAAYAERACAALRSLAA